MYIAHHLNELTSVLRTPSTHLLSLVFVLHVQATEVIESDYQKRSYYTKVYMKHMHVVAMADYSDVKV